MCRRCRSSSKLHVVSRDQGSYGYPSSFINHSNFITQQDNNDNNNNHNNDPSVLPQRKRGEKRDYINLKESFLSAKSCIPCKPIKTSKNYVIIGGGIAGICCAQELVKFNNSNDFNIIVISSTEVIKETRGVFRISEHLEEIKVRERSTASFKLDNPLITIINNSVTCLDTSNKIINLENGDKITYDKLAICSGSRPNFLYDHPNIIGIRDLQSVAELAKRLNTARNVVVVGNGGIAMELIHLIDFCNLEWYISIFLSVYMIDFCNLE
jgi:hypothetical protein